MEQVQADSVELDAKIEIERRGEAIGVKVMYCDVQTAARILLRAADLLLSQKEPPQEGDRDSAPELEQEMKELEALMRAGGRGQ